MLDCNWVSYSQLSPETVHFSHSAVSFTTISPWPCSLRVRREAEDKRREPSPQSSIMPQVEPENRPPGPWKRTFPSKFQHFQIPYSFSGGQ